MDSVHEEKKPFGCTICGASFTQNVKLEGHLESVHESTGHDRTLSIWKATVTSFLQELIPVLHRKGFFPS